MILLIVSVALLILLALGAFISATETAMTALNKVDISAIKEQHRHGEIIERLLQSPDRLIAALLIGNNVVNISSSAIVAYITNLYLGGIFIALSTFGLTLVVIILCEVAPKQFALLFKRQIAVAVIRPVSFFYIVFTPLLNLTLRCTQLLFPILKRIPDSEDLEESLELMVNLAHEDGYINQYERNFINNVLELNDKTARQIMTHRKDVFSLDLNASPAENFNSMIENSYSRIPVYRDDPENILGMLYMSDVQKHFLHRGLTEQLANRDSTGNAQPGYSTDSTQKTILQLLRPVAFLPDNTRVSELFFHFKHHDNNMVIILDEYGGLAGVVSQEDVLEVVFGKLYDEDEQEEASSLVIHSETDSFVFPGMLSIQQFEEFFHIELQDEDNPNRLATMSGYICNEFGSIPERDELIDLTEGRYRVLESDGKRIVRLSFQPKDSRPNPLKPKF